MKWTFNVSDDIKASLDSDYIDNKDLQYYKHLPESLRKFVIEPKVNLFFSNRDANCSTHD
jgi:hypothetical protein